jgi:hypothetical protein
MTVGGALSLRSILDILPRDLESILLLQFRNLLVSFLQKSLQKNYSAPDMADLKSAYAKSQVYK